MASGSAQGKLIVCGEHAVVYGHPALAIGIDRLTTVTVERTHGPTEIVSEQGVTERLKRAVWATVGDDSFVVTIRSQIPVGRGLGSSAALSVALVRAHAACMGQVLDDETTHARSLAVETVFHGTPSGIDNAVAAHGGLVRFRRTPDGPRWTQLAVPDLRVVVLDSGLEGDTGSLVAGVRSRNPANSGILEAIGALTDPVQSALEDVGALGPLLSQNHALLRQLGVSHDRLDALVAFALDNGATGAKLAGAGGGGVVIAVSGDPNALVARADAAGIPSFVTHIRTGAP